MKREDRHRQADILDAIEKIERWTGRSLDRNDDLYRAGVAHELGVIGEAAAHLSRRFQQEHNAVPWPKVVGLRNVLVHEYWDTSWAILERVIAEDLPALKAVLGVPAEPLVSLDVEQLLTEAARRAPFGATTRVRSPGDSSPRCGAWMPIARTRCVLRPGHFPATHHRSR